MNITCIIADDEPMALDLIEDYVNKTAFLELKGKFSNGLDALNFVNQNQVDLLFLDIQMPGLTGMEMSKMLINKNCRIIFTTAYDKYAVDGFKVDALDYLLKPFDYNEFLTAANKALEWFKLVKQADEKPQVAADYIFIKSDYKQIRIDFDDVYYFEGLKDYVKVWTKSRQRPLLTLMSLKTLEENLPADRFMRIHRSFIIALNAIEAIERNHVVINGEMIIVADKYKDIFNEFVEKRSI
ncbi:MAG: LytTR family DNA-binding domain-containing protein [Salinivirgaceae bacterium]|nr:LytTR family DNA-binding domain-containing protein [Salinivirgaceae bacterium]